jgi:hypothetical protein
MDMAPERTRRCFAVLILMAGGCFASDTSMDRATLRGLKAVKVVVDPLGSELEREGLDANRLRDRIEQKLRDAGIKIDNDVNEFIGLNVSFAQAGKKVLSIKKGPYSLTIGLGVYQVAVLTRDMATKTVVETWGVEKTASASARGLDRDVSNAVDDLVDQLVKAYLSVNPR